ncbi:uncharacterized protein LOC107027235 [Solanum pennellii]|uniref:Uncharacterized protein LOC107027235 n=1 Tax=Solanum pennellii TaxID=28526 RepID=A0ABM1HDG8_SOLPN|nr:uncharacterized protein LOC107027235 [Solanum pennellii]
MAVYLDEEEVWKCPKHPSKRRRNGVCPVCLKDRLVILCPDCANVRPCACYASATSSSSSASSSFSLFSSSSGRSGAGGGGCDGGCSVARVSNLIDSEPSFRRSRSVGIPFLRSSREKNSVDRKNQPNCKNSKMSKTPSFWSVFKLSKSKRYGDSENDELKPKPKAKADIHHENINEFTDGRIEDFARMMKRSRSMSVVITSVSGAGDCNKSPSKSKGWHFPSPMKVFRQSKASKLVHERSPLYRG